MTDSETKIDLLQNSTSAGNLDNDSVLESSLTLECAVVPSLLQSLLISEFCKRYNDCPHRFFVATKVAPRNDNYSFL